MKLAPMDTMTIINDTWCNSFSNVESNKNAISSRELFQMLISYLEHFITKAIEEIEDERSNSLFCKKKCSIEETQLAANLPALDKMSFKKPQLKEKSPKLAQ